MENAGDRGEPAVADIPELLHDALLASVIWDRSARELVAECHGCLRRNRDGTALENRNVTLTFSGLDGLILGLDPDDPFRPPSELEPPANPGSDALESGIRAGAAVALEINSAAAQGSALQSLALFDLQGDPATFSGCPVRAVLRLGGHAFGIEGYDVVLLAGSRSVSVSSGGNPLSLRQWAAEFEAWWEGWKRHWDAREAEGRRREAAEEDTSIPAGFPVEEDTLIPAGPGAPDPAFRPPEEPPFDLEPTDLPGDLATCLRDHFEGLLAGDWERTARANTASDDIEGEARKIAAWNRGEGFGHWGYAREVDWWWLEGDRAAVAVRGIEHTAPDEDVEAENTESVWTFALRRTSGRWVIFSSQQGWPPYGSAPSLPRSARPWLERWRSGRVIVGDPEAEE